MAMLVCRGIKAITNIEPYYFRPSSVQPNEFGLHRDDPTVRPLRDCLKCGQPDRQATPTNNLLVQPHTRKANSLITKERLIGGRLPSFDSALCGFALYVWKY
jgi:hypothetical protein